MKYDNLKTDGLPYKALYFYPGPKCLEPASKYSDLIPNTVLCMKQMSVLNYL